MGGRSAVGVALVVWIGLVAGTGDPRGAPAGLALILLGLPLALARWNRLGTLALLGVAFGSGLARGAAAERRLAFATPAAIGVSPVGAEWLRARVVSHPAREGGEPMTIAALLAPVDRMPVGARVRLLLPADCPAEWGDTLVALARLEPPLPLRVPGGLSGLEAARSDAVAALGRVLVGRVSRPCGLAAWPRATVVRWRRAIEGVFATRLSPRARELVTPLVTGDRSAVSPWLTGELQDAGLTHLLALSGLHVAWLASVARVLAAALGGGLVTRALAGAACALAYAGIAGPLPSLMRAVGSELLLAVARLTGRPLDPVQSLALTALVLLGLAPGWATDLGFQLSCAATAGLVTIGRALDDACVRHGPRALRVLLRALVPTLAAQVTALPLLVSRFHALPWSTLGANLAAVPVSGLLLSAAWLGAVLEALAPGSGALPLAACEWLATALRAVTAGFAGMPLPLVPCGHEAGVSWLAGSGAVLLAWAAAGPRTLDARRYGPSVSRAVAAWAGGFAVALALLMVATARPMRPPPGRWWLVALDVGQGDALALGFAGGWWLVDSGPRTEHLDSGRRVVLPFLRWAGVRRLEALILTHDDSDHTGGAPAVRAAMPIERVLAPVALPGVPGPAARFHAREVSAGDTLAREPLVRVLWPERGFDAHADNAAGLVLAVGDAATRALLMADVDSTIEQHLLPAMTTDSIPVQVLKVGHHGAASSSGLGFLERIRPRLALISCGRHNAFGHPAPVTLERLAVAARQVRRTDREGTLWVELSDAGAVVLDWRSGERSRVVPGDRAPPTRASRVAALHPVARPVARW
jgi:competence protein ComEC